MGAMSSTDYIPDPDETHKYARYKRAYETEREMRPEIKELARRALLEGATNKQLTKWTGLSDEFFRRLGREVGAKRLREPTVGRERAASTQQSATTEESSA
jgi:hypothetical protein